ncbi:MAG: spermidine synthase [bacterium]|nr:spermidine synthase [bacterium]
MHRTRLAALLFLLSGFSALVYQVIWQRILGIFSGVHIYSITMIVTAFMTGLGVGSLLGGRLADRLTRYRAVMGFAACEIGIGLFALCSVWLYYDVAYVKLGFLVRYRLALPLVHFGLLLIPTLLMGASLPLLCRGLVRGTAGAARTIGLLYGFNTVGAALGAFNAIWWMIGGFGFVGTIRIAAALNFVAAAGVFWIARGLSAAPGGANDAAETASPETAPATTTRQFGVGGWAALYWLSGFIALSLEILWFRILDVSIKQSPYTFGHLLGVFLIFLGLGGVVGAFTVDRSRHPGRTFLWGQWLISVSAGLALLALCRFSPRAWPLAGLFEFWHSDMGIVMDELRKALHGENGEEGRRLVGQAIQVYGLLPLALIALPTFLMGWTYAFVQRAVQTDPKQIGWRVGLIQTANIVGSIMGSLITGAFLLSALGTPRTLQLLLVLGSVFGCLAVFHSLERRRVPALIAVLAVSLALASGIPNHNRFWARFHGSADDQVVVSEDASSTVVLQSVDRPPVPHYAVMRVNGAGHSVVPFGGPHTILGLLPALIHRDPKSVLLIGLGAGNTPWAAAAPSSIELVEVYEIAKPELDVMKLHENRWFEVPEFDQLHNDDRLKLHFSDGRLAMRLSDQKYDLIEIDALEAYMAYSGNLYSREFFELARDRLEPGGLFVTYAPTSRTRRTVVSAFPHVLSLNFPGYLHCMLGSNAPIAFDRAAALQRLADPRIQAWFGPSARRSNVDLQRYIAQAEAIVIGPHNRDTHIDGDVNTDLFPRDEFDKSVPLEGD